jgi:hypothetical protein
LYAARVKDDAIIEGNGADVAKVAHHFLLVVIADRQKIQVFCWTQRVFKPLCKQHRAFQNEPVTMLRLTQAIEQPFINVIREQQRKRLAALLGKIQQA